MLEALLHGFCHALVGFVFAGMLPDKIGLFGWFDFVKRVQRKAPWIGDPIGACVACYSGQVALWTFAYKHHTQWNAFDGWDHLGIAAATAATVAYFIFKAYRWLESRA